MDNDRSDTRHHGLHGHTNGHAFHGHIHTSAATAVPRLASNHNVGLRILLHGGSDVPVHILLGDALQEPNLCNNDAQAHANLRYMDCLPAA